MSNIYIQEPPTSGKVLLVTSAGDVDVELWSKEAPKACRNFVQLCMEGYYNGTIFHRLVHDFIVQGGDPTGTGQGGESVYGKPFGDEFHSRLRFVRRGLVAMANAGAHDNGSQFFFTLAATPELNNRHTIFGKVGGNTIYNMLKLGEGETDVDEKPRYPHKIIKTKILSNPFDDIVPRVKKPKINEDSAESNKPDKKGTKNFQLLSFGEEAEEDEREVTEVVQGLREKGKSSHDLLNDSTLSSVPAVDASDTDDEDECSYGAKKNSAEEAGAVAESVRKKLKTGREKIDRTQQHQLSVVEDSATTSAESDDRLAKLKAETKRLKKDLISSHSQKNKNQSSLDGTSGAADSADSSAAASTVVDSYFAERNKYKEQSQQRAKKGSAREAETLKMLAAFQSKMERSRKLAEYVSAGVADDEGDDSDKKEAENDDDDDDDDVNNLNWTHHGLQFESSERKVLDANVHDVDRYEIFDPRNPLTVRRREESKRTMQQKR